MKNGVAIRAGLLMSKPASAGERDAPMVRAIPVTPAAAERSSEATTAIVYDWRVGTSICEKLNRSRKTPIAKDKLGIRGTSMSRILDGRCVNTIVLTSPIRAATRAAARAEIAAKML